MKKINIIIVVLIAILGLGCYKKTHCPEFPANLNYFPYNDGQELKFINSQHNMRTHTIAQIEKSKDHICKQTDKCQCECTCDTYSEFRTNFNQDSLYMYAIFWISGEGKENASKVNVRYLFSNFFCSDNFEKILFEGNIIPRKDILKYLKDTIVIENENNQIVKKIVIVKGKGLISYTTADGEEWKLVE